jgi:hypothetical protein
LSARFLVRFGHPAHGWLPLTIEVDGNPLEFLISCTPNDFLDGLINSLLSFLSYKGKFVATANEEPKENEFLFDNTGDHPIFRIIQYEDARRKENSGIELFKYEAEPLSIVLAFWRALRRLERQDKDGIFQNQWRRNFPTSAMQRLSEKTNMEKTNEEQI